MRYDFLLPRRAGLDKVCILARPAIRRKRYIAGWMYGVSRRGMVYYKKPF